MGKYVTAEDGYPILVPNEPVTLAPQSILEQDMSLPGNPAKAVAHVREDLSWYEDERCDNKLDLSNICSHEPIRQQEIRDTVLQVTSTLQHSAQKEAETQVQEYHTKNATLLNRLNQYDNDPFREQSD